MKITIEFTQPRSPNFAWVLRLCKKIKTFKETEEDGITVYSVDLDERQMPEFEAIHWKIYSWKQTAYYMDGRLVSPAMITRFFLSQQYRKDRLKKNPIDVIKEL